MITTEQILSRCTEEQLGEMMDSSLTIMKHIEFITGKTAGQLAAENEFFWKIYGLNMLCFSELGARAHGKQRIVEPFNS